MPNPRKCSLLCLLPSVTSADQCHAPSDPQGAFWGLMSGFIVGVIRMALDFVYMFDAPKCWETEDNRPAIVAKVTQGRNRAAAVLGRSYLTHRHRGAIVYFFHF